MIKPPVLCLVVLILMGNCTTNRQDQPPAQVRSSEDSVTRKPFRFCNQLVWRAYNLNRYVYTLDSTRRLQRSTAAEQTTNARYYSFEQTLTYSRQGLLDEVRDPNGSSRYTYQLGQLTAIEFFQSGQPVYRYQVSVNPRGQIIGLRGTPLNNSGLPAYSTQYRLDQQGRYVQLDVRTDQGVLYHRVVQSDFETSVVSPYALVRRIPYDLNRFPWISWGETFPLSTDLPRRIQTYRYAAPDTPTRLLKRSDLRIAYRTNPEGYMTTQYSRDALTTIRDTIVVYYQQCR